jgi:hypothetical protein
MEQKMRNGKKLSWVRAAAAAAAAMAALKNDKKRCTQKICF